MADQRLLIIHIHTRTHSKLPQEHIKMIKYRGFCCFNSACLTNLAGFFLPATDILFFHCTWKQESHTVVVVLSSRKKKQKVEESLTRGRRQWLIRIHSRLWEYDWKQVRRTPRWWWTEPAMPTCSRSGSPTSKWWGGCTHLSRCKSSSRTSYDVQRALWERSWSPHSVTKISTQGDALPGYDSCNDTAVRNKPLNTWNSQDI